MPALCFMIALFGGLYYLLRWAKESGEKERYNREVESKRQKRCELERKYKAPFEKQQEIQNKISSGQYYDEICEKFKDDFQYVFGWNWKEILSIPPKPPVLNPRLYKSDAYSFLVPANHIYWVYHLMLADEGLMDWQVISPAFGLKCGGKAEIDTHIKFVKCIEKRLICRGVTDVRFVAMPNSHWAPSDGSPVPKPYNKKDLVACNFIIEALANPEDTDRLW